MRIRLGAAAARRLQFLSNSRGRRNARVDPLNLAPLASFRFLRKYDSFFRAQWAIFES
jgi:hypothetical protein